MALKPLAEDMVKKSQQEMKEALAGSEVPGLNVQAVLRLAATRSFEYPQGSGRVFDVPEVPYPIGLEINDLFIRIKQFEREHANSEGAGIHSIYRRMLDEVIKLSWEKLIVPRSRWGRFLRWINWSKNPLRTMSEGDIGTLISFFLARRIVSSVRFHSPATLETESQNR